MACCKPIRKYSFGFSPSLSERFGIADFLLPPRHLVPNGPGGMGCDERTR